MPLQVYDLAMEAALRGQNCGPRNLPIKGEWQWLLDHFAATYGIRESYTKLTYLRWILMCAHPALGMLQVALRVMPFCATCICFDTPLAVA